MIVSVDVERILPDVYHAVIFEQKDEVTLNRVRMMYALEFEGRVLGWTNPDSNDAQIKVEFNSVDDAILFALKLP